MRLQTDKRLDAGWLGGGVGVSLLPLVASPGGAGGSLIRRVVDRNTMVLLPASTFVSRASGWAEVTGASTGAGVVLQEREPGTCRTVWTRECR